MQKKEPICDFELITRIKEGDEAAFRIIFDLYSSKLYYFSLKFLKEREPCQEVVQEVFMNVWINRVKLDTQYPIAPYLYTITRRLTLNVLRQVANSQCAMEKMWANVQKTSNETEEVVYLEDLERFTEQVLARLPKQQQLVYRMSRHQELSYDEIAEELNISRNTVKNHMVSALKTLRTQLQKAFSMLF
ncbi:MAG: RNA polymerase sigma-70 factor [Pedobacter sp.]|jgi:RNA polymerase sigma-70 factor (ECF subfamily)